MTDVSGYRSWPFSCWKCGQTFQMPDDRDDAIVWQMEHLDMHLHELSGPTASEARQRVLDMKIRFRQQRGR
jgi:hypothetical protein